MRPTRDTVEGRAYLDLQNKAKKQGRPTDEMFSLYALEGFLDRLSASGHTNELVLKGGVLLAAFDIRRATRDVDLQAEALANDADTVLALMCKIAGTPRGDGLVYHPEDATSEVIRDEDDYTGVRISMTCTLARAMIPFHIDVNVGDPISPAPETIDLPRLLGGSIRLRGYPMSMVHAEKLVTAISRGTVNTRWRDFGDIYNLSGAHPIYGPELIHAITTVAEHRSVTLEPLVEVLDGYANLAQTKYRAWRRKQRRDDLPAEFQDVLAAVIDFADPSSPVRPAPAPGTLPAGRGPEITKLIITIMMMSAIALQTSSSR